MFKNISKKTAFLTVEMESDNKAVAQTIFYFASSKDLQLSKPRFSIRLKASASGRQELEMSSDVLAKNVYVSFPGVEFNFNDNYFDMMPGIKYLIWSLDGELKRGDEKKIVLKSLFDTYQ